MTDTVSRIKQALDVLNPIQITIKDDSLLHAGHSGNTGGGHYHIIIVSEKFEGLSMIKRHRLIFNAVNDLMTTEIHALSIHAKTPAESGSR